MEALLKCLKCKFWSDCAKYVMNSCEFDSECGCFKIHFVTTEIPVESRDEEETRMEIGDCCLFRHTE